MTALAQRSDLKVTGRVNSSKGTRRSRTGCITCKIRRVKCDETRPACHRCSSTGRTCDGYPAAGVPSQHSTRRALATAVRQLQVVGPAARVLGKPVPVDDVACFDFFRVCTASMTGSVFPGEKFWSMQMLQAAHAEPAVWTAAVALGALHRRWEFSNYCLNPDVTRRSGPHRDNSDALQFTHQALKHYVVSLSLARSISDPNILAILSVALGAAAHLAGRWADSQVHIRAGLRILREMGTQIRTSDLEGAAQALERLDAQAMTLSDATSPYEYTSSILEESRRMLLSNRGRGKDASDQTSTALLGPINDLGQATLAVFRLMRQFFIIADAVTTGAITPREFEYARLQMVKAISRWKDQLATLVNRDGSSLESAGNRERSNRNRKVLILSLRLYSATLELLLFAHGTPPGKEPNMSGFVGQQDPGSPDTMDLDCGPTNNQGRTSPHEAFIEVKSEKFSDIGSSDETRSKRHTALNSQFEIHFTPPASSTSSTDSFHLPFRAKLGAPGFCANPGYLSLLSSANSRGSSKSINSIDSNNPPQIQPKAPVAPSSPNPVLVPLRSPSPFTSALPSPRLDSNGLPETTQSNAPPSHPVSSAAISDKHSEFPSQFQPHAHFDDQDSSPEAEPELEQEFKIPTSETRWDALHGHFALIVNLASQIAANTDSPLPFFMSLEPGLAMPLYLTVKRCRHPVTRRKALGLLRRLNRQEGIWNCALAARAAEEVILLEEGALFDSWSEDDFGGRKGAENKRNGGLLLPLDIFERVEEGGESSEEMNGLLEHYKVVAMEKATRASRAHGGDKSGLQQDSLWPDGWPSIPENKRIFIQYPIFKLEENQLELLMFVMGDMRGGEEERGRMAKRVVVDLF
ncbi:hypothetical protein V8F20_005227 [Naviculisporaceae sp. PSN 640]